MLTRLQIRVPIDSEEAAGVIAFDVNLSGLNQPVTITEPTGYITLQEFMQSVLGNFMSDDATVQDGLDGMSDIPAADPEKYPVYSQTSVDVNEIQTALYHYYTDRGRYPMMVRAHDPASRVDGFCLG